MSTRHHAGGRRSAPVSDRHLELLERATGYFEQYLWTAAAAAPARQQLADRGLSEKTLRTYRVGLAPAAPDALLRASRRAGFTREDCLTVGLARTLPSGTIRDAFRARVTFPVADHGGRVLGFGARATDPDVKPKYLNTRAGEFFRKGELLFGSQLAAEPCRAHGEVVLCEGYVDVLAAHQAGVLNVVGAMGTALTDEQAAELATLAPRSLLAFDADAGGQDAALRGGRAAAAAGQQVRIAPFPPGCDPADVLRARGPEQLRALLQQGAPLAIVEVEHELASADLHDAEAKDRSLDRLRPIFAAAAPDHAVRAALVDRVAAAFANSPEQVSRWIGKPEGALAPSDSSDFRAQVARIADRQNRGLDDGAIER